MTPLTKKPPEPVSKVFVSGVDEVTSPRRISSVAAVYPSEDRYDGFQGKIFLEAVIGTDGVPKHVVVLSMPEGGERLAGAAVEAVQQWRYEPGTVDGEPVRVYFNIVMTFRIGESD